MTDIAKIAEGLTREDKECLLDLAARRKPWLMGSPAWSDHYSRLRFYDLGLIDPSFPDAKPGDSGRQHWVFNARGLAVRSYLKEQDNG